MEVILVTGKPEYRAIINAAKTIQSSNVDIVTIIDTEVFLNHHYDICFYCFRDNFPFQMHMPIKIAKQLLDRNEGPITLKINKNSKFTITAQNDLMEIFPSIQQAMQEQTYDTSISKTSFTFQFWDIQIQFIILNQIEPYEWKLRQAIQNLKENEKYQNPYTSSQSLSENKVNKAIIFINDENCEHFLAWGENQSGLQTNEANTKLSKEYLSLKQQIDNQKNSFRNKIKMVETLLGENINVQKLQLEEKQQNVEFKRLKETFETIKNIDKVLIDQEKRIQNMKRNLKEKKTLKNEVLYEKVKKFTQMGKNVKEIVCSIEELQQKLRIVEEKKNEYLAKRSFEPTQDINSLLGKYVRSTKKNLNLKISESQENLLSQNYQGKRRWIDQKLERERKRNENESNNKTILHRRKTLIKKALQETQLEKKQSLLNQSSVVMNQSTIQTATPLTQNTSSNLNNLNPSTISNSTVQSLDYQQNQSYKSHGINCKTQMSFHKNLEREMAQFRSILINKSEKNRMKEEYIMKSEQKNHLKIENQKVNKEISQLQVLLLQMADYYRKSFDLLQQIERRNIKDSQFENSLTNKISNNKVYKKQSKSQYLSKNQEFNKKYAQENPLNLSNFYILVQLLKNGNKTSQIESTPEYNFYLSNHIIHILKNREEIKNKNFLTIHQANGRKENCGGEKHVIRKKAKQCSLIGGSSASFADFYQ